MTYKFGQNESLAIDYAKAIGIIVVVIGHYYGSPFEYYRPYMYHMPLFFFIGGMLLNTERPFISHFSNIMRRHALYIATVYILIAFIVWAIHTAYPIKYSPMWKGDIWSSLTHPFKSNFHGGSYFVVAWFLFAYLLASLIAQPLLKGIKHITSSDNYVTWTTLALACASAFFGVTDIAPAYQAQKKFYLNTMSQVSVGLSFFLIGYALRPHIFKFIHLYGFITGFMVLYVMHANDLVRGIGMSWSKYPLGFYAHMTTALIGIYSVLFISRLLAAGGVMRFFRFIGLQSKSIMAYHLLAFIFVDIVFFEMGLYDITKSSRFGHFRSNYSWPIYISSGVIIPLAISSAWAWLISKIRTIKPNALSSKYS